MKGTTMGLQANDPAISSSGIRKETGGLSRDAIKYIAAAAMLLNHIANVFLPEYDPVGEVLKGIGYFTAPSMIYFLVEGYHYTSSKKRYFFRLLLFAVISEFPFCFALGLGMDGRVNFVGFNMLFSLSLCFGLIWIEENVRSIIARALAYIVIFSVSMLCDWFFFAPVFTLLFLHGWIMSGGNPASGQIRKAFSIAAVLFGVYNYLGITSYTGTFSAAALAYGLINMSGVALAGVCIVKYYNGRRSERGKNFSKWFFYIFYPAHLAVLGLIKLAAM